MDFMQTLIEMSNGQVAHELNENLHRVLAAVKDTGKKGKLALTIEIAPHKIKDFKVCQVTLTGTCKIVEPVEKADETIFHLLDDATLSRDDPRQIEMEAMFNKENK